MIKRTALFLLLIPALAFNGCVKETYNMDLLSKNAHLSPSFILSANGDVSLSDMVKANDTITFDQNKLVTFIYRKNSIVDIKLADFAKGIIRTAEIEPGTIDLDIDDFLNRISGTFQIISPTLKFNYTNSFPDPITINLNVTGIGKSGNVNLNNTPFVAAIPDIPQQQVVSSSYIIDKTNSNLSQLISLPPRSIDYSGSAVIDISGNYNLSSSKLAGSLEISIPLELRINNLQYSDTVDNFLKDESNNPVNPSNFHFLSMKVSAKNGFPFGFSMKMSTYDSITNTILRTVDAGKVIEAAPVDANGKSTGFTESSPVIQLTKDFFTSASKSDKIIFTFTLVTTGNGTTNVKIYSDYRIIFKADVVVKPDIDLGNLDIFKKDI
jgi:hypothetical protein